MTPERLQELDDLAAELAECRMVIPNRGVSSRDLYDLLDHIHTLTRQLESARDIAVRCGAFETWTGTDVETYVER